ncbi:inositol monophosphatase family protein [Corynebacterium choanae]|uniref:Inositol-1-monophosphatase n=1 Tax=Corynebacterium choanae TaxID=1862358 RepID=A0A3G6J6K0_9CORY|nr:inositol monophosphatase family protein [Corynebacterium choanae]AZA13731.1 Inositol-1-monophosphatase [Corynebacterium choanae]
METAPKKPAPVASPSAHAAAPRPLAGLTAHVAGTILTPTAPTPPPNTTQTGSNWTINQGVAVDSNRRRFGLELVNIALAAATHTQDAVACARELLGGKQLNITAKASAVDPVTVVDIFAQQRITEILRHQRPHDTVIGEETTSDEELPPADSEITWIVDPIDGTVNFIYGIPAYGISICAVDNTGYLLAGVIANCATGEVAYAWHGGGAHLVRRPQLGTALSTQHHPTTTANTPPANATVTDMVDWLNTTLSTPHHFGMVDQQATSTNATTLHPAHPATLAQALLATGFSYQSTNRKQQATLLTQILPNVRDIRRRGSAAIDLLSVAHGQTDCYLEHCLNVWDWAAGILIAAEAGAIVSLAPLDQRAEDNALIAVCAPSIADEFTHLLNTIPQHLTQ